MAEFLLLRPAGKCEASTEALSQAGLSTVGLPLIAIEPDSAAMARFPQQLDELQGQSKLIFVSTPAVELAIQAMQGRDWPAQLSYFAVGAASAEKLQAVGLQVQYPERQDSEGLLDLAELKLVNGQPVLLVKGEGGRELLSQTLADRGAKVQEACLYRRQPVPDAPPTEAWQTTDIQCIIATSAALVDAAFDALDKDWLVSTPWILVSDRLAGMARSRGIKQIMVSRNASDAALIEIARQFMEQKSMAEANQSPDVPEPVTHSPEAGAAASGSGRIWPLVLLNLLMLAALAGAGYWGWIQLSQAEQREQELLAETQTRLSQQQQRLREEMASQLADQRRQWEQMNAPLSQQLSELQAMVTANKALAKSNQEGLNQVSGRRPDDWLLAEADYLVRMAGRKLWLERDLDTAILMLESADTRLADMTDPSLLTIRQMLADDIQTLRQLDREPLTRIALELGALTHQVDNLPLDMVVLPEPVDEGPGAEPLTDSVSDWRTNLKRTWQSLVEDFITVRRRTEETKPLLSDKQQWLVREQLRHYLLQAQQAVLQEQPALYPGPLKEAGDLLDKYFAGNDSRVAGFAGSLQELQRVDIGRHYPAQLQSAQPLEDLLQRRLSRGQQELQP